MYKRWLLAAWLLATALPSAAVPLQVTELRGSVQQGERPLRLLETLHDGASLALGEAALLVLWDSASDRRYMVAGPARLTLAPGGPALADSGRGSVQMLAPRRAPAAKLAEGTVMAGAIMRAGAPAVPASAPLLPLAQAVFSWRNRPHLGDWRFRLYDEDGQLLHEARVAERHYRLPPAVLLAPERAYRWQLAWDDGRSEVLGPVEPVQTMALQEVGLPSAQASTAARLGAALQLRDNGQVAQARALAPELFGEAP